MTYPTRMNKDSFELTLVGAGEPLLRLQRRLGCAAAEAGLTLQLDVGKKRPEAVLLLRYEQTPAVLARVDASAAACRTENSSPSLRALTTERTRV